LQSPNRQDWMVYGAYGFTGELVVREAIAQGRRPILAGRNEASLKPLADKFELPLRPFDVGDAAEHLDGVGTLINCAGPFASTAEPLIAACLQRGLHYFDVTGEISIFQAAHKQHEAALKTGVILCPGVGFDIVPTDCLAALLKQALPDATHLELAFDFGTLPSMGTTRTAIQSIGDGCLIRENGVLKSVRLGYSTIKVPFASADLWAVSLPWGDVFTSHVSTRIPNAIVYGALPHAVCWLVRLSNPLRGFLARPGVQKKLVALAGRFLGDGPDESKRISARTGFWGRVTTGDGRECSGTITGPSVYAMTAELAVAIALKAESWEQDGGYFTASMLVGADFLSNREGYKVEVQRVSEDTGAVRQSDPLH